MTGLFSTHTSLADRVQRLEAMRGSKFVRGPREMRPEDFTITLE